MSRCNIYYLKYSPTQGFLSELIQTCHHETINDIAFPQGYSEAGRLLRTSTRPKLNLLPLLLLLLLLLLLRLLLLVGTFSSSSAHLYGRSH